MVAPHSFGRAGSRRAAARLAASAVGLLAAAASLRAQQPTIRSAVDLVVAEAQVVDAAGKPVPGLTPDRFEVTIDGKKQRVMLADFVSVTSASTTAAATPVARDPSSTVATTDAPAGRVYALAIDSLSFNASESAAMIRAAKGFVDRLQPGDYVGVFTYPTGPQINPTTDRAAVNQALDRVRGAREPMPTGRFVLRPSEIVDLSSDAGGRGPTDASAVEVIRRECGTDQNCQRQLLMEAQTAAQLIEAGATLSFGGLRTLLQGLGTVPGRKTMVLVTAGMVASDRPGARPDASELSVMAGQDAARSNVMLYTLFVDTSTTSQSSAERRSGAANRFTSGARDGDAMSRWFDQLSATAGGLLIRDQMGSGEIGYDRILSETSALYRLGIEAPDAIRDGKPHRLKITVNGARVTVRGRSWVIVSPKTPPA